MRLIDADNLRGRVCEIFLCAEPGSAEERRLALVLGLIDSEHTIAPPPNDPLTLKELREMDGEPVWCEKFEWRICYGVSDFRGCLCMETGAGSCIQLNDYGKTWRAYRRKPEEETK